jgi:hypothetical protein
LSCNIQISWEALLLTQTYFSHKHHKLAAENI